jgi:RNA-dependent RNA polymerase
LQELQEFFVKHMVNDNLGQISNAHVVHVDLGDDNARSANCKELARLFSVAVDFPKTGVPATIPYLLRPDRYPDFMEKEDKEMYESRKIIGKLFRSVKEASSEKITSQISRDLIWESYDSTLIVLGYEEYVEEASSLKNEYDQKLMGLMNRYGIKTEAEVMSNNILQMSRQYHKRNEDVKRRIQLSVSALCREARQWFFEGDDDNEDHEDSRYGGHDNYAKASAWYHVTYCADFLDPEEDKYLLSFPWVVYDVLLAIKQGCISHH